MMDAAAVAEANVADHHDNQDVPKDSNISTDGEAENRFQTAIAAWRSRSSMIHASCVV